MTSIKIDNPPIKFGNITLKTIFFSTTGILVTVLVYSAVFLLLSERLSLHARLLTAGLFSIITGMTAVVIFAKILNAPLLKLARFIQQREKHWDERIRIATKDEVASIAEEWNRLLDELDTYRERVVSTNRELMETARQAGMAEVTVGVLHNVGNVLNSLGVTTHALRQKINHSRVSSVGHIATLFIEKSNDLHYFLTHDSRGRKLPEYLLALSSHLSKERERLLQFIDELDRHLNHTRDIINLQQTYSRSIGLTEAVRIKELIKDALQLNMSSLIRRRIRVEQDVDDLPPCLLDRHKVMQILANLIHNANEALNAAQRPDKVLTITTTRPRPDRLRISVADNGIGISRKNLRRIFSYGFTTRKEGHGFGLHSGALAAKEMQGTLQAKSDGPGLGATFILELPFRSQGE